MEKLLYEKDGCTITHCDRQNGGFDYQVETPWTWFDTFKTFAEAMCFLALVRLQANTDKTGRLLCQNSTHS